MARLGFPSAIIGLAFALLTASSASAERMQSARGGSVLALVIGIDDYPLALLKGAVADARDLARALGTAGVADLRVLLNKDATRTAVLTELRRLAEIAKPNDLVIVAFAGHGLQVRESVPNSKPNHLDEAYALRNFDPGASGAPEMIIGPEMKHWLAQLDAKGIDVFFVADTCHGGGLTRTVDLRADEVTYRNFKNNYGGAANAALKDAMAEPRDSFRDDSSFKNVTFLAAVDPNSLAPEVEIPGEPTKRGALSYAVARWIESSVTAESRNLKRRDLVSYALQVVKQYAHDRQTIYTAPTNETALDVSVWSTGKARAPVEPNPSAAPTPSPASIPSPTPSPSPTPIPSPTPSPSPAPVPNRAETSSVKIKVVHGDAALLASARPIFATIIPATPSEQADLIWDAATGDVIVAGDVVAQEVTAADLPAVADRTMALAALAKISEIRPQTVSLLPNSKLHRDRDQEHLAFVAPAVRGKYLIVFNIAGDGTVQFLYPNPKGSMGFDKPRVEDPDWRLEFKVVRPYGSDTLVALSSDERLEGIETQFRSLSGTKAVGRVPEILETVMRASPTARLGFAGVFTGP